MFSQTFQAGWGDMDFNAHLRNTAYLDFSATTRMLYFEANGFPMSEFRKQNFGPVVLKDEIEYFKEVHLLEQFTVKLLIAGFSTDNRFWKIRNIFYKNNEKISATVSSLVGWLDLRERKLIAPPEKLKTILINLDRADDFQIIE
ncbi:MAG: thioesterase family protein [Pyrinomonadaceae bacterium]|nr:thioesterase family protein [Pyrinomonadaceae bacterium]